MMINPRGSLREIQAMMVPELKAQGWRVVVNPKRDYFPELDEANKNNQKNMGQEIDGDIADQNILKSVSV